jgi:hypothetical protein
MGCIDEAMRDARPSQVFRQRYHCDGNAVLTDRSIFVRPHPRRYRPCASLTPASIFRDLNSLAWGVWQDAVSASGRARRPSCRPGLAGFHGLWWFPCQPSGRLGALPLGQPEARDWSRWPQW